MFSKLKKKLIFFYLVIRGAKVGLGNNFNKIYVESYRKVTIGSYNTLCENINIVNYGDGDCSFIMGDNNYVGRDCEFNIGLRILIGDDCLIASGCKFIDSNHGIDKEKLIRLQKGSAKNIVIKNDVWLGSNVIVLQGVTINTGAVVAAGAVVTKDIPAFEIWGGVPARKIGERK